MSSFFYRFNAASVLADHSLDAPTPASFYRDTFQKKTNNIIPAAGRTNQPDPNNACFLYENPRFINEPICFVNTKVTHPQQEKWWPNIVAKDIKPSPQYKADTVSRSDYKIILHHKPNRLTRYGCNSQRLKPAKGIVPSNSDDQPMIAKEKISFEHQFDSRQGRKERGKLHGSFVWEPIVNKDMQDRIKLRLAQQESHIFN